MSEAPLPEPLEDFLQHPPILPMNSEVQAEVAQRTSALLPRRRRRRWTVLAALAASVVLALMTAYLGYRIGLANSQPREDVVQRKTVPIPKKVEKPDAPHEPKPPVVVAPPNPRELEWTAFDAADDQERVRLYFQAGDLYLDTLNDYEAALRCYHQALHYSAASELEFNAKDNWLVMALKRDHRKEK